MSKEPTRHKENRRSGDRGPDEESPIHNHEKSDPHAPHVDLATHGLRDTRGGSPTAGRQARGRLEFVALPHDHLWCHEGWRAADLSDRAPPTRQDCMRRMRRMGRIRTLYHWGCPCWPPSPFNKNCLKETACPLTL